MSNHTKVRKFINLSYVIITPQNIRELSELIEKQCHRDLEDRRGQHFKLRYILEDLDNTTFEAENSQALSKGGILDTRKIISVKIDYYNYSQGSGINVRLEHDPVSESTNKITIDGYEEILANGLFQSFEEKVSRWKKQPRWPRKYYQVLSFLSGFAVGLLAVNIYDILLRNFGGVLTTEPSRLLVAGLTTLVGVGAGAGALAAPYVVQKVFKLYPIVEFATGPQHLRREENRRRTLYKIAAIVIIPIILGLLFNFLK